MTLAGGEEEETWDDGNAEITLNGSIGEDLVVELKLKPDQCEEEFKFVLFRGDVPMSSDRYQIQTRGNVVQLTLKQSQKEDTGHYALVAKKLPTGLSIASDDRLESRHKICLNIQDSAKLIDQGEPPTFLRRLSDLAVKVGTRTRFLVEIRSSTSPKVTWHKNDVPVQSGSRLSFVHEGNFYCVNVAPVMVDDQGHWTCMVENASGRSSCTSFLSVIVPKAYKKPEFVEELRAILTETGTVSLECKVIGVPTPVLKWFKDQKEIKAGDVFALTANLDDPTSLGTYTCEAVNCMGSAYSSSRVHVVGRGSREGSLRPADALLAPLGPLPIFNQILRDESCKIGDNLTLSCQVGVPPWPRSITWYNKEGRVEPSEKYHFVEDGLGGYSVEIRGVEAMDEGEWKCVATSNEDMKQFSTCHVAMAIPKNYRMPRFMESLKAVLTEEGLVSFECKVVGFPTPSLRWFKDGQELHPGDVYQLTGTNSLGSYCCIARNCMGETKSIAELTVEDIKNQLNEEERMQLLSSNQAPKFVKGLRSCEARINEDFTFTIKVSVSPEPCLSWYRDDVAIIESEKYRMAREALGTCNLEVRKLEFVDQAEWKCIAENDFGHSVTSCFLKLIIPKHYKKPKFLESLRAILSEEGAVNLECKVIGVPQPILKWYKDGVELKPGDIHRIISGQDGTCCLGTYTCEASNCMGSVSSSASLLGFEDHRVSVRKEQAKEPVTPLHELARNLSLSTIHEERTSQLYDTPQTDHSITMDDRGEVSFSFDGKEVSVSLYETPDLTEEEALQIVEMYADQLSEHITEGNVIELPPMRFTKETSTSGNLLMEAVVIDVSPDYFVPEEEGDDLRTEADVEDVSIMDDQMHSIRSLSYVSSPSAEIAGEQGTSGSPPSRPPRRKQESRESFSSRSETSDKSLPKAHHLDWSESYHSAREPSMQAQEDSIEAFTDALSSSGRSRAENSKDIYASFIEQQSIENIPLEEATGGEASMRLNIVPMAATQIGQVLLEEVPLQNNDDEKNKNKNKKRKKKKRNSRTSLSSKASSEDSYAPESEEKSSSRRGSKTSGISDKSLSRFESAMSADPRRRESDATIIVDDVRIEQMEELVVGERIESSYASEQIEKIEENKSAPMETIEPATSDPEKSLTKSNKERLLQNIYNLSEPVMSLRHSLVDFDSLLPLFEQKETPEAIEQARIEITQKIMQPVEILCEQVSAIETKALKSAGDRSLAQNIRISILEAISGPTEELLRGIELIRRQSNEHQELKSSLIVLESLTDPVDEILVGLTRIEQELTSREAGEFSIIQMEKPIALERFNRAVSRLGKNVASIDNINICFDDESTNNLSVMERLRSIYQSLEAFISSIPLSEESTGSLENNVDTLVVESLVRPLEELSRNLNKFEAIETEQEKEGAVVNLAKCLSEMRTRLEALTIALETYEKESGEQGMTDLHADLVKFLRYTTDDATERLQKSIANKRMAQETTGKLAPMSADESTLESSEPEESMNYQEKMSPVVVPEATKVEDKSSMDGEKVLAETIKPSSASMSQLSEVMETELSLPEMLLDPLIEVQANLSDVISEFESQSPGNELAACLSELRESVGMAAHRATSLKSANMVEALVDLREPLLDLQLAMASIARPEELKLIQEAASVPLRELKVIVAGVMKSCQASEASRVQLSSVSRMLEEIQAEVDRITEEQQQNETAAPEQQEPVIGGGVPTRPPEHVERAAIALTGVHFGLSTVLERAIARNCTNSESSRLIEGIEELRRTVGDVAVAIGTPIVLTESEEHTYEMMFDELSNKLEGPLVNLQKILLTEEHEPEERHLLNDVATPIRSLKEVLQSLTKEIIGSHTTLRSISELVEDVEKDVTLIAMEALKKTLAAKSETITDEESRASVSSSSKPGEVPTIISKWLDPVEDWLTTTTCAGEQPTTESEVIQTESALAIAVDDLKRELLKIAIESSYSEPPSDAALIESLTELQEPLARLCQVLTECHEPESLDIVDSLGQPTKHLLGTILDASLTHESEKVLRPVLEAIQELENQIPLTIKRATYERELQRVVRSMTPEEPQTLTTDQEIPESSMPGQSFVKDYDKLTERVIDDAEIISSLQDGVEMNSSTHPQAETSKLIEEPVIEIKVDDSSQQVASLEREESKREDINPPHTAKEIEESGLLESAVQEDEEKVGEKREVATSLEMSDDQQSLAVIMEAQEGKIESQIETENKLSMDSEKMIELKPKFVQFITVDNRRLSTISQMEMSQRAEATTSEVSRADQLDLWTLTLLGPLDRLGNAVLTLDRSIDELAHGLLCRPLDSLHKQIEIAESQFNRPIGQSLENDVETIIEGFLSPLNQLHSALEAAVDVWNEEHPKIVVRDLLRSIADSSAELCGLLSTLRQKLIEEGASHSLQAQQEDASLVETINAVTAPLEDVRNLIEEALKNLEFVDLDEKIQVASDEKIIDEVMIDKSENLTTTKSSEQVTGLETGEMATASVKETEILTDQREQIIKVESEFVETEKVEKTGEIDEISKTEVPKRDMKAKEDSLDIEESTAKPLEELIEAIVDSSGPRPASSSPETYQSLSPDVPEEIIEKPQITVTGEDTIYEEAYNLVTEKLEEVEITKNKENAADAVSSEIVAEYLEELSLEDEFSRVKIMPGMETTENAVQPITEILPGATEAAEISEIVLPEAKQADSSQSHIEEEVVEKISTDLTKGEKATMSIEESLVTVESRGEKVLQLQEPAITHDNAPPEEKIEEIATDKSSKEKAHQLLDEKDLSTAEVLEAPGIKVQTLDAKLSEFEITEESLQEIPSEKITEEKAKLKESEKFDEAKITEAPEMKIQTRDATLSELPSAADQDTLEEISTEKIEEMEAEIRQEEKLDKATVSTPEIKIKPREVQVLEMEAEDTFEAGLEEILEDKTNQETAIISEIEKLATASVSDDGKIINQAGDAKTLQSEVETPEEIIQEISIEKLSGVVAKVEETDSLANKVQSESRLIEKMAKPEMAEIVDEDLVKITEYENKESERASCSIENRELAIAKVEAIETAKLASAEIIDESKIVEIIETPVQKIFKIKKQEGEEIVEKTLLKPVEEVVAMEDMNIYEIVETPTEKVIKLKMSVEGTNVDEEIFEEIVIKKPIAGWAKSLVEEEASAYLVPEEKIQEFVTAIITEELSPEDEQTIHEDEQAISISYKEDKEKLEEEAIHKEKVEAERKKTEKGEKLEQERIEVEEAESERIIKEEKKEKVEAERKNEKDQEKVEKERIEIEKAEEEREKKEAENKLEKERIEKEKTEAERKKKEQEKFEKESIEKEKAEVQREKKEAEEKLEKERFEEEKAELERKNKEEQEKFEKERIEKEKAEAERKKKEEEEKLEKEKVEAERKKKEEQEKLEKEKAEAERKIKEEEKLEKERIEKEKAEAERKKKEEQERLETERIEKEKAEAERKKKEEQEKLEKERIEKEKAEAERKNKEEQERLETERIEKEKAEAERKKKEEEEKLEKERIEKEKAEAERKKKEEEEKLEKERKKEEAEAERQKKEEQERLEKDRIDKEKAEAERKKKEQEKLEAERKKKEEEEKLEKERIEKEKAEAERKIKEEQEKLEKERVEKEKAEAERKKKEEQERLEKERIEKENAEAERKKKEVEEKLEKERIEKEKIEAERKKKEEQDKLEAERKKKEKEEKLENERIEKEKAEAERIKKEEQEKLENERIEKEKAEAERKKKEEQEKLEKERIEKEKAEAERKKKEEEEKLEKEKVEAERKKKEEQEKLEKEKAEAERKIKEEEKLEKERIEKEKAEAERKKKEEQEKLEKERIEKEKAEVERKKTEEKERLEKERIEKEKAEAELKKKEEEEKLEKERIENEKAEAERKKKEEEKLEKERIEKEKVEAERKKKEEQERLEKAEAERKKKEEAEKLEKEKVEAERKKKEEQEKLERERIEKEKADAERKKNEEEKLEKERVEKEKAETERKKKEEQEKLEKERIEKEKAEAERKKKEEQEKLEMERMEKEKAEAERKKKEEQEKLEKERMEKEKAEAERKKKEEQEKLEKERMEKEKAEAERKKKEEQERLEKERMEKEKAEAERKKKEAEEKLEKERIEKEKAETERKQKEAEEKLTKERIEKEKAEAERKKKEAEKNLEKEKVAAERKKKEEEEKLEKDKAEIDRKKKEENEKHEKDMLGKEKADVERLKTEEAEILRKEAVPPIEKESECEETKEPKETKKKEAELLSKKEEKEEVEKVKKKKNESPRVSKKRDSTDEGKKIKKRDSKEGSRRSSKTEDTKDEPKKLEKFDSKDESTRVSLKKRDSKDDIGERIEKEASREGSRRRSTKAGTKDDIQEFEKDTVIESKVKEHNSEIKSKSDEFAERGRKDSLKGENSRAVSATDETKVTNEATQHDVKIATDVKIMKKIEDRPTKGPSKDRKDDVDDEEKTPTNVEEPKIAVRSRHRLEKEAGYSSDRDPHSSSTIRTDSEMDSEYSEVSKSLHEQTFASRARRKRSNEQIIVVEPDLPKDHQDRRTMDRQWSSKIRDEILSTDNYSSSSPHYPESISRIHEFTPGPRDRGKRPSFCTKLTDRTAAEGSRIKLTCTVLGEPEPHISWTKDGRELPVSSNRHCTTEENGMVSLELYAAQPKDSGEYSCIAKNVHGQAYTEAKLKVYAGYAPLPSIPTFTRSIKDVYRSSEDELVLECRVRAQPNPKITWLKDGQVLELSNRYQQADLGDGICRLRISRPDFYDSGLYTCKAENDSRMSDCTSHVVNFEGKVKGQDRGSSWRDSYHNLTSSERDIGRPKFSSYLTDHSVPAGGTIALQVEVKGVPPPDITWLRGDKREPIPAYKARTFADSGVYTLVVPEATESETGTYVCRASNAYGYVDTMANVEVVSSGSCDGGKPAMFVSRPAETLIHVTVGEDVSVSFRAHGVPKPRIIWMKGLRDITNGPRSYKESSDDYVRLTLKRTAIEDEGTYCIMVKNRYGCDRTFYTVKIKQRARSLTPSPDWGTVDTDSLLTNIHDTERSYLKQVPGPITSEPVVVDGGRNWLALTWGKAIQHGPAPVVAYRVDAWQLGGEGGARWLELGMTPVNAFDAFNLRPGGEYKFRITPRNRYGWGEATTMKNSVTVREVVKFPEFSKILPGQLKALRGECLHLECEIRSESRADVKWYRDTTDIESINDPRYMTHYSGSKCSLTVQSIKEIDTGRYVCEATNPAGRVSTFARVQVVTEPKIVEADEKLRRMRTAEASCEESPPEFTMRLRDRRVQMTYPVRLTCQVSGYPTPEVTWYKNGEEIFPDDNISFWDDESHFHTLEISHSSVEDSGVYMVKARNFNGSISCHCNLVVDKGIRAYVAPEFLRHLDAVYTVKSGGELRMTAQVEAYPTVGILWHRDGHRLRPSRSAVMTLNHDGSVELSLAHVTPRDAGLYCCTATNEVGQAESTTRVTVITSTDEQMPSISQSLPDVVESLDIPYSKEPVFVTKPLSTEAFEGDTVIILCEVIGDPKPEVIWLRDFLRPDYYRDAAHFRRVGAGPQYRLEIPYAKLDFTGAYTVIAKNCHGEAKAIISLQIYARTQSNKSDNAMEHTTVKHGKVQTLPSIKRPLKDLRCCDGDAVTLICKVFATPEPDVRWEKSGKLVPLGGDFAVDFDGETARLSIQHVYPEDEGEYTCVAYNDLGKAYTSACLIVDVPEGKESALSRRLMRPIGLLSAESTPISTPRSTPIRSLSPSCVGSRRELKPSTRSTGGQSAPRQPRFPVGPKFYAVPHNRVAEEGETVRFQCAIAGHPTPWVSWDKDGVPVTPTSRISLKEKDDVRILEIAEINHEDAGLYRIILENDVGRTEATARLEIIKGRSGSVPRTIRTRSASPRTYSIYSRSPVTSAIRGDTHLRPNIYDSMGSRGGTLSPTLPRCHHRNGKSRLESPEPVRRMNQQMRTIRISNGTGQQVSKTQSTKLPISTKPRSSSASRAASKEISTSLASPRQTKPDVQKKFNLENNRSNKNSRIITNESMIPKRLPKFSPKTSERVVIKIQESKDSEKVEETKMTKSEELTSKEIIITKNEEKKNELTILMDKERSKNENRTEISGLTVENSREPRSPVILAAPADVIALRGTKVMLLATFDGEPQPRVKWLRRGRDVRLDDKAEIETRSGLTCLTLEGVTTEHAGKYAVTLENIAGRDCRYVNLTVEGVPEPPAGKPCIQSITRSGKAIVTWRSPSYDGGCAVTGYSVEMKRSEEACWIGIAEARHSLSHTVTGLVPKDSYRFRVRAENAHGLSEPSSVSELVTVPGENDEEIGAQVFTAEINQIEIEEEEEEFEPAFEPRTVVPEDGSHFEKLYDVKEELGKGRYGIVKRAVEKSSGINFAAKFVRTIKTKDRQQVQEEIAVMNRLRHPKLLRLAAAFENPREMILVMEYISGGELFERVVADDFTLTEKDSIQFVKQICEGVEYMHSHNVVHLDLKPENIMCHTRTSHRIKLIDFGLAQTLNPDTPVRVLFGTPEFIPPEIIGFEPIGTESDMWSVGVICYVLLTGLSPFMGDNDAETFANITRADYDFDDKAFAAISSEAKDFISALLVKRKESRMSATQCLKHPWLAQQAESMSRVALPTDKLKKFIVRRKWQKTGNAIRALGRMAILSANTRKTLSAASSPTNATFGDELFVDVTGSPVAYKPIKPIVLQDRTIVENHEKSPEANDANGKYETNEESIETHDYEVGEKNDKCSLNEEQIAEESDEVEKIVEIAETVKPETIDEKNVSADVFIENHLTVTEIEDFQDHEKNESNTDPPLIQDIDDFTENNKTIYPVQKDGLEISEISEVNSEQALSEETSSESELPDAILDKKSRRKSFSSFVNLEISESGAVKIHQEDEEISDSELTFIKNCKEKEKDEEIIENFELSSNFTKNQDEIRETTPKATAATKNWCKINHSLLLDEENENARLTGHTRTRPFVCTGSVSRKAKIFEKSKETNSSSLGHQQNLVNRTSPMVPEVRPQNERIRKAFAFWNK